MVSLSLVACIVLAAVASATNVSQCPGGKEIPDLTKNVNFSPCKKLPCRLRKGTDQHVSIKFVPESDFKEITNHITGEIGGVVLPFIGVDGTSACDKLENEDGTKAECPVRAGQTYIYKEQFPILPFYPSTDVKVHWAFQAEGKDIVCFEVASRIQ